MLEQLLALCEQLGVNTEQTRITAPILRLPDRTNSPINSKINQLSRRAFLKAAVLAVGLALTSPALPVHSQAGEPPPLQENDISALVSKEHITLGPFNISAAAHSNIPMRISSETLEFPAEDISIHAFNRFDTDLLNPPRHGASFIQSTKGPAIAFGHTGYINGKLPFEPIREVIEGKYKVERNRTVAQFVGPVQTNYRIQKLLENTTLDMNINNQHALFGLAKVCMFPHRLLTGEVMSEIFEGGDLKTAMCRTTAGFAVQDAKRYCIELGIDSFFEQELQTLQVPEASDEDIYNAIRKIYFGIKSKDPALARYFQILYSREVETPNGFINLSEERMRQEPVPEIAQEGEYQQYQKLIRGNQLKGIEFYTAGEIVATWRLS